MGEILAYISTKNRYDTTLPLSMMSVASQTKKPDKFVLFDDNEEPIDLRESEIYKNIFKLFDERGIAWEVIFGEKKGQHFNHQKANQMGYKWCWRMDDDCVAESNVLEILYSQTRDNVGAVGGSILTKPNLKVESTGKIENLNKEPNIQWGKIKETKEVEHLHCSFLYRAGVQNYCLGLSRIAHREETLFTYELFYKGYKIIVTPCVTWHLKTDGGIRSIEERKELFEKDEVKFNILLNNQIVVLDNGIGDHICFKSVYEEMKKKGNVLIFGCYPQIFPEMKSIAEAVELLGDIRPYNVYYYMDAKNHKGDLEQAFRKMYL